jgi:geranylgeranyl diphosphate synthase, type I
MANAPALSPTDARRVNDVTSRYRDAVTSALRDALDRSDLGHVALMRRHFGFDDAARAQTASKGGKLLRPALLLLCCEAVGGDPQQAMPAAAAIELVHNFTLIHDDIEDASDTRHGRETLWRIVGVPLAINAGDGMFVLGQRTLLRMADAGVPAERVLLAAQTLNDACTAVCEGQHRDIGFETRDRVTQAEYEAMIDGKTGALLGASMAIGAIAGGADPATVNALGECGRMLGRAFQIQDDVLGIWGESSVTGKPVADDIRSRKRSFPIAWAFEHFGSEAVSNLERIYSSETIGESDVDAVVSLLNEAGAADAATTEALRWANAAVDGLAPLDIDDGSRRDISALAAFAVHRSA